MLDTIDENEELEAWYDPFDFPSPISPTSPQLLIAVHNHILSPMICHVLALTPNVTKKIY